MHSGSKPPGSKADAIKNRSHNIKVNRHAKVVKRRILKPKRSPKKMKPKRHLNKAERKNSFLKSRKSAKSKSNSKPRHSIRNSKLHGRHTVKITNEKRPKRNTGNKGNLHSRRAHISAHTRRHSSRHTKQKKSTSTTSSKTHRSRKSNKLSVKYLNVKRHAKVSQKYSPISKAPRKPITSKRQTKESSMLIKHKSPSKRRQTRKKSRQRHSGKTRNFRRRRTQQRIKSKRRRSTTGSKRLKGSKAKHMHEHDKRKKHAKSGNKHGIRTGHKKKKLTTSKPN